MVKQLKKLKKKQAKETYTFNYPKNIKNFQTIQNMLDFKSKLKEERKLSKEYACFMVQKSTTQDGIIRSIYARCFSCKSSIIYRFKKQTNNFVIKRFDNFHRHQINLNSKKTILKNILRLLPSNLSRAQIFQEVKKQMTISDSQFTYYIGKIRRQQFPKWYDYTTDFRTLTFGQYWRHPLSTNQQEIPEVFIFNFNNSKDIIGNQVSFFMTQFGFNNATHYISCFNYLSKQGHSIPCGFAFFRDKQVTIISAIIEQFRRFSEKDQLNILIPFQEIVAQAIDLCNSKLQSVRFRYLFNKTSLINKLSESKHDQTILQQLVKIYQRQDLEQNLNKFYKQIWPQSQILAQIIRNPDQYFLPYFKTSFKCLIGVDYYLEDSEKTLRILGQKKKIEDKLKKKKFTYEIHNFITRLYKVALIRTRPKRIGNLSYIKYEDYFNQPEIFQFRYMLCKKIFLIFLQSYAKSFKCQIRSANHNQYVIQFNELVFHIRLINQRWDCDCGYNLYFGLPCLHQMFVLRFVCQDRSLMVSYIASKWIINPQNVMKQKARIKKNPGRPKCSRKNVSK